MNSRAVIKRSIITERATDLTAIGKYVFMVEPDATKNEVKKAVKAIYNVDVVTVNIVNQHAKTRRYRNTTAKRGGYKKAIATLKEGQKIDIT